MMCRKDEYKSICGNHPEIPVYAQYWWLEAASENWDAIIAKDERGDVAATMPYIIRKKLLFTTLTQPLQSLLLGIHFFLPDSIASDNYKRQTFEEKYTFEILAEIEKLNISFFNVKFAAEYVNHLPFFWAGYSQTTRYTYRLDDISDLDSLFCSFQKSKQKHIRKAQREGLTTTFDDLGVEDFIDFHRYTYKKRGEADLIDSYGWIPFLRNVASHPNTRFVATRDKEGTLLSVFFLAWDSEFAYYLLTGIDQDKKSTGAPSLMLWDTFNFLQGKTKGFDFEGSMARGIGSSHREFGAELVPYHHIYKYFSTPFMLLRKVLGKGE